MLDIKFICENKDLIASAAKKKFVDFDVEDLIATDNKRKELLASIEKKRKEQNDFSDIISKITEKEKDEFFVKMKEIKEALQKEEAELKDVIKKWQLLMVKVPNIPDMSVPDGTSDADNQEIKTWGKIPNFAFKPKGHIELMQNLDIVDFEKGAKVAGFRGYFLKGDGVLLNFAIWQYVLSEFLKKGDFSLMMSPSLVRKEPFIGTGFLPQGEEDLYKTQDEFYLAGTSEVATMGYFMDDVLLKKDLPKKVIAFSPCFRREAGSHGRDTKGLMRVHEFFKLEQVVICEANHNESVKHHEFLLQNSEEILQALKIPYRVVVNCTGDLGLGQVKKYDIEAWVPTEEKFRETHSCSYFHDFQTRRLNIKYKDDDGKMKFAHSLNNTAIATPRILISIIENYQMMDGSIRIPKVLQPYIGKEFILPKGSLVDNPLILHSLPPRS